MANTSIEYSAANADEAIAKGLKALGLTRDQVDVVVLDAGSRGFLGFGGRQARVRISLKEDTLRASMEQDKVRAEEEAAKRKEAEDRKKAEADKKAAAEAKKALEKSAPRPEKRPERKPEKRGEKPERKAERPERSDRPEKKQPVKKPQPVQSPVEVPVIPVSPAAVEIGGEVHSPEPKADGKRGADIINEETKTIASNVVRDLMEKMRVKAEIEARTTDAEDEIDSPVILIDIKGDDLSYLIGRHSEVLHSLQYITSLIVGREVGHWVPLVLDIQGYRERRERQLRQMAATMAEQVVKTGRRISLEPMPATERRVIHLALRENPNVITESVGDEPNRKVMIYPKNRK